MLAGHFGAAFAAKRAAPRLNLGVLFAATLSVDVVWSLLVIAGIEHYHIDAALPGIVPQVNDFMPYSHSLAGVSVCAAIFVAALFLTGIRDAVSLAVAALTVGSHWVLDWIAHRPDMTILPASEKLGLGLWNWTAPAIAVELGIFLGGIWLYRRATFADGRGADASLAGFAALIAAVQIALAFAPPSKHAEREVLIQVLFIFWAMSIDRHHPLRARLALPSRSAAARVP